MGLPTRRGFTILEVMVGAAILAIAIVGLLAVLTATSRLQQSNRETAFALNGIRDKLEELRNYPNFNELDTAAGGNNANLPVFRFYSQSGTNPRSGLPWNTFNVTGLNPDRPWTASDDQDSDGFRDLAEPGDTEGDGIVGMIHMFINETLANDDTARVGMPLDLDGDGLTTTANTNIDSDSNGFLDYNLLPITVRIEWRSGTGSRQMQVSTKLARRQ